MADIDDDLTLAAFVDWLGRQSGKLPRNLLQHYLSERGHEVIVRLPFMYHRGQWTLVRRMFPYQLQWLVRHMDDPITPGLLMGRLGEMELLSEARKERRSHDITR